MMKKIGFKKQSFMKMMIELNKKIKRLKYILKQYNIFKIKNSVTKQRKQKLSVIFITNQLKIMMIIKKIM